MPSPDPVPDGPGPAEPSGTGDPTPAADPTPAGDPASPAGREVGAAAAALAEPDLVPEQRRQLLGRIRAAARERGPRGLIRPSAVLRWIADMVGDIAPHIPIRDLDTLRRHHDGLEGDALAERLVRNACRATAGVGAASGGVAAVKWVVTPAMLSAPVLLAAETVAIVAIEVKLIGELHEVYRRPIPGSSAQRAGAMVHAWAQQRGVNPMLPGVGTAAVLGTAARKELSDRLLRRFGRNLSTLGPLLTGAAVAAYLNRRATRALSEAVRRDLREGPRAVGPA